MINSATLHVTPDTRHSVKKQRQAGKTLVGFRVFLLVALVVVGVAYVTKVSELSASGYHVRDVESQLATLRQDTDKLQNQIASIQSMPNIARRLKDLNMVNPVSVSYVK